MKRATIHAIAVLHLLIGGLMIIMPMEYEARIVGIETQTSIFVPFLYRIFVNIAWFNGLASLILAKPKHAIRLSYSRLTVYKRQTMLTFAA